MGRWGASWGTGSSPRWPPVGSAAGPDEGRPGPTCTWVLSKLPSIWKRFSSALISIGASSRRVNGMMNRKPVRSVNTPGVTSNSPPATTRAPSISRSPGGRPCCSSVARVESRPRPSRLASQAPRKPVTRMISTVAVGPMRAPSCSNRNSSTVGTMVNRSSSLIMRRPPWPRATGPRGARGRRRAGRCPARGTALPPCGSGPRTWWWPGAARSRRRRAGAGRG